MTEGNAMYVYGSRIKLVNDYAGNWRHSFNVIYVDNEERCQTNNKPTPLYKENKCLSVWQVVMRRWYHLPLRNCHKP